MRYCKAHINVFSEKCKECSDARNRRKDKLMRWRAMKNMCIISEINALFYKIGTPPTKLLARNCGCSTTYVNSIKNLL